jgi:hypothetical protein
MAELWSRVVSWPEDPDYDPVVHLYPSLSAAELDTWNDFEDSRDDFDWNPEEWRTFEQFLGAYGIKVQYNIHHVRSTV